MKIRTSQIAAVLILGAVIGYLSARKYQTEREIHLFDCRMKELEKAVRVQGKDVNSCFQIKRYRN